MNRETLMRTQANSSGNTMGIASVRQANELVLIYKTNNGEAMIGEVYRKVANYITDEDNEVCGTTEEYSNLIQEYIEYGDYKSAYMICVYAIGKWPYCDYLLGEGIYAAAVSGETEQFDTWNATVENINKDYWSARTFTYVIKAHMERCLTVAGEEEKKYWERALTLSTEYQEKFPLDERACEFKAELYLMHNMMNEAGKILFNAIFNEVVVKDDDNRVFSEKGSKKEPVKLLTGNCCMLFLQKILDRTSNYDLIIRVAEKGLKDTLVEQPTANVGYFEHWIAMAKDAQCEEEKYINPDKVREALQRYQTAFSLLPEPLLQTKTAVRYKVLQQHARDEWANKPLVKQPLYVNTERTEEE